MVEDQKIPERIGRLWELAHNLWWSWHDGARRLFRALDYPVWRTSHHNPVEQLRRVSPEVLKAAASDPAFLSLYDAVMAEFDADVGTAVPWLKKKYPQLARSTVAYFSMEYAIHQSLPIYAGGLGILAGDICKEASDFGLPLVAVGFMYPQGYFHQHITLEGWQEEHYRQLDFAGAPIRQLFSPRGDSAIARVDIAGTAVGVGVWLVRVGGTAIYLLDTDLEGNPSQFRQLSARLYVADRETRLQQEIVLGIGGVRVLRALGITPDIWHGNEGHTAFMMLERIREEVAGGASFAEAKTRVQAVSVFTTHTPVLAGNDFFPLDLVETHFRGYWKSLGIDREAFLKLGGQDDASPQVFNMTALALRLAAQRSAVSLLHEGVTRKMWRGIWPDIPEDKVPISHVTNGIHISTWIAPELYYLLERHLGKDWIAGHDDDAMWERFLDIPDEEIWALRQQLNRKLVGAIRERMRSRWIDDDVPWRQMMAMGALLDPGTLTLAFVRRFTEYKRPSLLFHDKERLKRIVNNELYPVQIIFAGKSHPADLGSKYILQQVYSMATEREYGGRIVFIEDYDMHMARYLVQGVDVWLNTPRRLQEACGTSGMKGSLNGVLQLSVLDGWWYEGYNGRNGWAINPDLKPKTPEEEDAADAETLYRLLEEEVVPLYYRRDRGGVPHEWIGMVKETIRSVVPAFCARRMLKEYTEHLYHPATPAPPEGHH